jgi:ribosomal protein S18 acetylase RimI-like enzyme
MEHKVVSTVIKYHLGLVPNLSDIVRVFENSGIVRPTADIERINKMFANSNLVITAWDGEILVGICRCLTDFSYCCYLSDLAVDKSHQRKGIGQGMIDLVKNEIGEKVTLILLSAAGAMNYYPKIGFEGIHNGFVIKRSS